MRFNLVLIVFIGNNFFCGNLAAQEIFLQDRKNKPSLTVFPNKCVTLRKGRDCHAQIKIKWQASQIGYYCIQRHSDKMLIYCWKNKDSGEFDYTFRSKETEQIDLVIKLNKTQEINNNQQHLAEKILVSARIKLSWVYRTKKRKGRWRIF